MTAKSIKMRWLGYGVFALALFSAQTPGAAQQWTAGNQVIAVRTAVVDGLKLQYLTAGHGPAIVLLHGYAETSRMWRPLIPRLAERFRVIAPDLPGIGGSDIPADGLDMARAARPHSHSSRHWVSRRRSWSATTSG